MATESPLQLIGSGGGRNWHASRDSASFTSSSNVAGNELEFLFQGTRDFAGPNRSGSAPPSMEGSSLAIGNLRRHQNLQLDGILENMRNATADGSGTGGQRRSDVAYYYNNDNLNPRLPRPAVSRDDLRMAQLNGAFGGVRKMTSFDDSIKRSSTFMSRPVLSTHKEEEPEDDNSPRIANDGKAEASSAFVAGNSPSLQQGRHKSLVDLIQEDFPRTPSPVYNNQSHQSGHGSTEPVVTDASGSMTKAESKSDTAGVRARTPSIPGVQSVYLNPKNDASASVSPSLTSSAPKGEAKLLNANTNNGVLPYGMDGSSIGTIDNNMKSLRISDDVLRNQLMQPNLQPRGSPYNVQIGQSEVTNQMPWSTIPVDHYSHGQPKLASSEVQPALISPAVAPALYATAAAYGSPYYSNLQSTNLFHPQLTVGGYAMNSSLIPPFLTGYSPYTAIPMPLENPASANFGTRAPIVSTGGSGTPVADMHSLYKFYGQFGVASQPSFSEHVYMPYFQNPSLDAYASTGQYVAGNSLGNYDLQRAQSLASQSSDQRPPALRTGSVNILPSGKGGTPNYSGSSQNVPVIMQYPTSPIASPLFQGSPVAGRRNENVRFPFSPGRAGASYSGWQGHRGQEKLDDQRPPTFLEELKSSKSRRYELSDIAGRIVEFSADQHGSRFIQQKLETCNAEEKAAVFQEVLPQASALMTDVFGNYVIQKFFEHGNPEQRKELANKLVGNVLPLSLQMYGCRVIQKALEVIEIDQKTKLVHELDGHVMHCVRDQNGNHVIQKCIECVPTENIDFIISSFCNNVAKLSMHPYGCRVIQRVLEHCSDELQCQFIVDEILQNACPLAQDQYGNYVTQHVLERGKALERTQIIKKLAGQIVQMSQHKFASNVIEKCLEYGSPAERDFLIEEIVGQTEGNDNLLVMMKDQYANYVVQKILETCNDKQREILIGRVKVHLQALKKYTYGKHIVARVEQLIGEDSETLEQ